MSKHPSNSNGPAAHSAGNPASGTGNGFGWIAFAVLGLATIPAQVLAPSGAAALLAVAAAIAGAQLAVRRTFAPVLSNPLIVAAAVLVLWAVVSAIWSIQPRMPLKQAGVLVMLVVAWAAIVRGDLQGLRRAWRWIVAGIVIGFAVVLFEQTSFGALNGWLAAAMGDEDTWKVPRLNRAIALSILMACPVFWLLWRTGKKWLVGVLAAGALAMIAYSASDSERIALVAGIIAWLGTYAFRHRFVYAMTAITVAGILLTPLWVKTVATPENLHAAMPDIRLSALQRTYMWDFAVDRTFERPVLGWGFDTSRHLPNADEVLETEIFHARGTERRMGTHPHNWFVQTWVELGAVGAVLLAALAAVVGGGIARRVDDRGLQAAMAGCLGFALVLVNLMWGMWQSWWLSSLGIACLLFSLVGRLANETGRPSRAAP